MYSGSLIRWIIYNSRMEVLSSENNTHVGLDLVNVVFTVVVVFGFYICRCPKSVTLTTTVHIFSIIKTTTTVKKKL